jgi:hypothetical protein
VCRKSAATDGFTDGNAQRHGWREGVIRRSTFASGRKGNDNDDHSSPPQTPFKVLRPADDDRPNRNLAWRPLRKSVADLHRRAQVSQRANDSYLGALAAANDDTTAATIFDQVSRPVAYRGRRVRALRIGDKDDIALLGAVSRGEWATAGFRNRDLRGILHSTKRLATVEVETTAGKRGVSTARSAVA